MFYRPPESLRIPGIGVTDRQEQLDTPPMASVGGMEQGSGVMGGRVDPRMVEESGHSQVVTVPRCIREGSLKFVVHGLGLRALVSAGRKKPCCDILFTLDFRTVKARFLYGQRRSGPPMRA